MIHRFPPAPRAARCDNSAPRGTVRSVSAPAHTRYSPGRAPDTSSIRTQHNRAGPGHRPPRSPAPATPPPVGTVSLPGRTARPTGRHHSSGHRPVTHQGTEIDTARRQHQPAPARARSTPLVRQNVWPHQSRTIAGQGLPGPVGTPLPAGRRRRLRRPVDARMGDRRPSGPMPPLGGQQEPQRPFERTDDNLMHVGLLHSDRPCPGGVCPPAGVRYLLMVSLGIDTYSYISQSAARYQHA